MRFGARATRARLARDARPLGLGAPRAGASCSRPRRARAPPPSARAQGVVRLAGAARAADGRRASLGIAARSSGPSRRPGRALVAPFAHEGPGPLRRRQARPAIRASQRRAPRPRAAGCDEALLFDAAGRLVEGARTSLVVVRDDGAPGRRRRSRAAASRASRARSLAEAVRGLARGRRRRAPSSPRAREIIALNAVRGARPIVRARRTRRSARACPGPPAARLGRSARAPRNDKLARVRRAGGAMEIQGIGAVVTGGARGSARRPRARSRRAARRSRSSTSAARRARRSRSRSAAAPSSPRPTSRRGRRSRPRSTRAVERFGGLHVCVNCAGIGSADAHRRQGRQALRPALFKKTRRDQPDRHLQRAAPRGVAA